MLLASKNLRGMDEGHQDQEDGREGREELKMKVSKFTLTKQEGEEVVDDPRRIKSVFIYHQRKPSTYRFALGILLQRVNKGAARTLSI